MSVNCPSRQCSPPTFLSYSHSLLHSQSTTAVSNLLKAESKSTTPQKVIIYFCEISQYCLRVHVSITLFPWNEKASSQFFRAFLCRKVLNFIEFCETSCHQQNWYKSLFENILCFRHVVVCGHITKDTVESFLREFLHPDRQDVNEHVVFLNP